MAFEPAEEIVINGLRLRINPTDIIVTQNKNPEIVPMIRSSKVYTYISKFCKGTAQLVFQFDINNETDQDCLIKLCTYMDLYPFMFIKSEKLERYTHHTYQGIFDYQIYGVNSYSLETNSRLQGVYILAIDLNYFNYTPFANSLAFVNLETVTTESINPQDGTKQQTVKNYNVAEVNIEECRLFNDFFSGEILARTATLSQFLADKGRSYVGFKIPQFYNEEQLKSQNIVIQPGEDIETLSFSEFKDPATIMSQTPKDSPFKDPPSKITVRWEEIGNPYFARKKAPEKFNLNGGDTSFTSVIVTKRNCITEQNLTSYTYPVLQYMGRGQVDIQIMIESDLKNKAMSCVDLIKNAFSKLDVNYQDYKQLSAYNVIKIESAITCMSPIFGVVKAAERTSVSSQNQGIEETELYLIESDNREILKRAQFIDVGSKDGLDFDVLVATFKQVLNYLDKPVGGSILQPDTIPDAALAVLPKTQLELFASLDKKYGLPAGSMYGIYGTETNFGKAKTPASRSAQGAQGPFQFIKSTAVELGLTDPGNPPAFDNRFDFNLAADASAKYLSQQYKRFGDISSAFAAYNMGPGAFAALGKERALSPSRISAAGYVGEALQHNQRGMAYISDYNKGIYRDVDATFVQRLFSTTGNGIPQLQEVVDKLVTDLSNSTFLLSGDVTTNQKLATYLATAEPIKNGQTINGIEPDTLKFRFKRCLEDAYIELTRLAAAGNNYAAATISSVPQNAATNILGIEDEFRDQGLPDLEFDERFSPAVLTTLKIKDFRSVPPFFFLAQNSYINMKQTQAVFGQLASALSLEYNQETSLNLQKDILTRNTDVVNDDDHTYSKKAPLEFIATSFDAGHISKLNTGEKSVLDESLQVIIAQPNESIDPFSPSDICNQQAVSVSSYFRHGMNLAFPALKVYIVEGDETNFSENFQESEHIYYALDGIIECSITTSDDENPVDVLNMVMSNPGSVYTDSHVLRDKYKPQKDFGSINTPAENKFIIDNIIIKPGIRLHVRAGYGNDPGRMETVFNGLITAVGGEHVIEVVAEGFGRELSMFKHGDEPYKNGFFMNANTASIIGNALNSGEVEHFGVTRFLERKNKDPEDKRLLTISGSTLFSFIKKSEKYTNIFLKSIEATDPKFNAFFFNALGLIPLSPTALWYEYPIYKTTPWEMLKEMEYRHPGTLSRPANYEDRSTYFFGLKEQLYVYRQFDPRLYGKNELSSGNSLLTAAALGLFAGGILGAGLAVLLTDRGIAAFGGSGDELYNQIRSLRFKPICDLHIASSEQNIIHNKIKLTEDFATVVNVQYADLADAKKQDYNYFDMKVDDNLKPSAHRQTEIAFPGINDLPTAVRYGSVSLRRELEKMYDGSLKLIGNARIKAHDMIFINDKFRNMHGLIKAREVVHKWSIDEGFTTYVTPGLYVETSYIDYPINRIFPALGGACYLLSEVACDEAGNHNISNERFLANSFVLDNFNQHGTEMFISEELQNAMYIGVNTGVAMRFTAGLVDTIFSPTGAGRNLITVLGNKVVRVTPEFLLQGLNLLKGTPPSAFIRAREIATGAIETFGERFGIARLLGQAGLAVGSFIVANPVSAAIIAAVALIGYNILASTIEKLKARQPVRIYPLKQNNFDYVSGIYGYKLNPLFDSIKENVVDTFHNAQYLYDSFKVSINQ